jgi:DNA replication and repair protein RecF
MDGLVANIHGGLSIFTVETGGSTHSSSGIHLPTKRLASLFSVATHLKLVGVFLLVLATHIVLLVDQIPTGWESTVMRIRTLVLNQFRNLPTWQHEFGHTTIIHGLNGAGKTSVLEALMLASSGASFRANKIEEVIRLGQELARIQATVLDEDDDATTLELLVTRGEVQGKRTLSRLYAVNGVRRRKKDFIGQLAAVVFRPEDMRLIEGSPSRRRNFLDTALSIVDWQYAQALSVYDKTLKQRNRLLSQIAERKQSKTSLTFWNTSLVKHGEYIQLRRQELINFLQGIGFRFTLRMQYLPSLISEERLAQYIDREVIVGHSLIGPHKDDFMVQFPGERLQVGLEDWFNIALYGSRGQQRLAVLWLKLGELEFVRAKLQQQPLLLLDDILSELDAESRSIVLELLDTYQTIVTTADGESLRELQSQLPQATVIAMDERLTT